MITEVNVHVVTKTSHLNLFLRPTGYFVDLLIQVTTLNAKDMSKIINLD